MEKRKILIAEPNEDVRKVLVDYSADFEDYEVIELNSLDSLKKTLESIVVGKEKDIKVIITNPFKVPDEENALDLIEEYSSKINVPIIVVSGRGNAWDYLNEGAFAYIRKPFDLQTYKDVVSKALKKPK